MTPGRVRSCGPDEVFRDLHARRVQGVCRLTCIAEYQGADLKCKPCALVLDGRGRYPSRRVHLELNYLDFVGT